jgi:hypothetical protein
MYDLDFEQQISIIIKSLGKIDERLDRIEKTQEEHGKLLSHLVESHKKQNEILELLSHRAGSRD